MKPVVDRPEARLLVTLNKVDLKQLELAAMTWFLAPFWLVGLPYQWARVELSADVVLTSAWGEVLYRAQHTARCTRTTGLYYGRRDLTFGCPGQKIAEAVRERVSLGRADVLARVERGRPRERSRPSKPSPVPVPVATTAILPMPTAAVFNIRDMSGQFNERVIDQLTEYLSARVAAELSYKVVPREEIRSQLADSKQESFRPCYEESCQIEVGKALAASKSVSTTLLRIGNQCAFTSTVFDLKTEAADRAASIKTPCDEDALLDGVDRVVQQLEARVSR